MNQMRELTLNYDNASKHADEMMIINSEPEKRFATEMKIAIEKISGILSRYNDATNSIAKIKSVDVDQENNLKNAVTEKEEIERQHSELAANMDDMDSQLNKTSSEKESLKKELAQLIDAKRGIEHQRNEQSVTEEEYKSITSQLSAQLSGHLECSSNENNNLTASKAELVKQN